MSREKERLILRLRICVRIRCNSFYILRVSFLLTFIAYSLSSWNNVMAYPQVYGARCVGIFGMPLVGYEEGYWNNTVSKLAALMPIKYCLALPISFSPSPVSKQA